MSEEFVTYEQALALKELGFNEECFVSFFIPNLYSINFTATTKRNSTLSMGKDGCTAPLKQQVFRWFREKYGYYVDFIIFNKEDYASPISKSDDIEFSFVIYRAFDNLYSNYDELFTTGYSLDDEGGTVWDNYEEAEDVCINTLVELAKQKINV